MEQALNCAPQAAKWEGMCIQAKPAKIRKLSGIRIEADREGECW